MPVDARLRRAAERAVRFGSSSVVRAAGVDVTEQFAEQSCLVVAPHPDDETFGCGATIARERAQRRGGARRHRGGRTSIPATRRRVGDRHHRDATEPSARRRSERLGVDSSDVVHLDFEDGALSPGLPTSPTRSPTRYGASHRQVLVTSTKDRPSRPLGRRSSARVPRPRRVDRAASNTAIWQRVPALTVAGDAIRSARSESRTAVPRLDRHGDRVWFAPTASSSRSVRPSTVSRESVASFPGRLRGRFPPALRGVHRDAWRALQA